MLLHCRSGLLKLHPTSTGQEAVDSSCILFVPYFQSGSCLRPQNHNISLLEIGNSDQQGNAACLRPIKHEVGRMPLTELTSSTFSPQKPTYWLQQELQICRVTNPELQFVEIRNTNLYPVAEIEFCGGAGTQAARSHPWPVWVTGHTSCPCSSSRNQLLFRHSGAIISAQRGWLVGVFLSVAWFWLHYNCWSLKRNDHEELQKTLKHDCLLPGELSITNTESTWRNSGNSNSFAAHWLSQKSIPPYSNTRGWRDGCIWIGPSGEGPWAIGMCFTHVLTWYIGYIFTTTVCTASRISVSS